MNNPLPRMTLGQALDMNTYQKRVRLERKTAFRSFVSGKGHRKNKPIHGKRKY